MPHDLILRNVRKWPEHWQAVFQEMRIIMGMENAYNYVRQIRGGVANA